jgi:hypothetical protein
VNVWPGQVCLHAGHRKARGCPLGNSRCRFRRGVACEGNAATSCVILRSRLPVPMHWCVRESRKIAIETHLPQETQTHRDGGVIEDNEKQRRHDEGRRAKFKNGALFGLSATRVPLSKSLFSRRLQNKTGPSRVLFGSGDLVATSSCERAADLTRARLVVSCQLGLNLNADTVVRGAAQERARSALLGRVSPPSSRWPDDGSTYLAYFLR